LRPSSSAIAGHGADIFDLNTDLIALQLGDVAPTAPPARLAYDESVWWESVVATATFNGSVLAGLRLNPIDLGTDRPLTARGLPRLATADRATAILSRLAALSQQYGTAIRIENGAATIDLAASRN
jgi:hypothetical protein